MGRACARVSVDYFSSPLSLSLPPILLSPLSLIFENCLVLGTFCLDGVGYGLDLQRSRENSYPSSLQKRRFGLSPTIFVRWIKRRIRYSVIIYSASKHNATDGLDWRWLFAPAYGCRCARRRRTHSPPFLSAITAEFPISRLIRRLAFSRFWIFV